MGKVKKSKTTPEELNEKASAFMAPKLHEWILKQKDEDKVKEMLDLVSRIYLIHWKIMCGRRKMCDVLWDE